MGGGQVSKQMAAEGFQGLPYRYKGSTTFGNGSLKCCKVSYNDGTAFLRGACQGTQRQLAPPGCSPTTSPDCLHLSTLLPCMLTNHIPQLPVLMHSLSLLLGNHGRRP